MDVEVCAVLHIGAGLATVVLVVDPCRGTDLPVSLTASLGCCGVSSPGYLSSVAYGYDLCPHTEDPQTMGYIYKALAFPYRFPSPQPAPSLISRVPSFYTKAADDKTW